MLYKVIGKTNFLVWAVAGQVHHQFEEGGQSPRIEIEKAGLIGYNIVRKKLISRHTRAPLQPLKKFSPGLPAPSTVKIHFW